MSTNNSNNNSDSNSPASKKAAIDMSWWIRSSMLALLIAVLAHNFLQTGDDTVRNRRAAIPNTVVVEHYGACVEGLEKAAEYNAIFFDTYSGSSNVGGKLAVGGDITSISTIGIGSQLTNVAACRDAVLVVGGKIDEFTSGRVWFGNVVTGAASDQYGPDVQQQTLEAGCCALVRPNAVNFGEMLTEVTTLAAYYQGLANTYTSLTVEYGSLSLALAGADLEIVNVAFDFFTATVNFVNQPTNYKPGSIIVFNIAGTQSGISNVNLEAFKGKNVIFNFYEATTLTIKAVDVKGTVLAPYAAIPNAEGTISGHVFAQSMSGPLSIEWVPLPVCQGPAKHQFDCTERAPRRKICGVGCETLDFEFLQTVNAIIFGYFQASSIAQGRVFVGGDALFSTGYSIGDQIVDKLQTCQDVALVVGGTLRSWMNGRLYGGSIVTGQPSVAPEKRTVYPAECCKVENPSFLPFRKWHRRIKRISACWATRTSTVVGKEFDDAAYRPVWHMSGDVELEVASAIDVLAIENFDQKAGDMIAGIFNYNNFPRLIGANPDVPIIFNIPGTTVKVIGGSMEDYKDYIVVFNFYEATSVFIHDVGIRAHIVAPYADIIEASGVVHGTVVANSLTGPIALYLHRMPTCAPRQAPSLAQLLKTTCEITNQPEGGEEYV